MTSDINRKEIIVKSLTSAANLLLSKAEDVANDMSNNRGLRLYVTIDIDNDVSPSMSVETSYTLL